MVLVLCTNLAIVNNGAPHCKVSPSWLMFLYLRLCNRSFLFTNMLGSENSNSTTQNHYLVTWWMVVASSGLPKHHRLKKKWFHKMVPPPSYKVVYNPYYNMTLYIYIGIYSITPSDWSFFLTHLAIFITPGTVPRLGCLFGWSFAFPAPTWDDKVGQRWSKFGRFSQAVNMKSANGGD